LLECQGVKKLVSGVLEELLEALFVQVWGLVGDIFNKSPDIVVF
jgi:hypothetical protein